MTTQNGTEFLTGLINVHIVTSKQSFRDFDFIHFLSYSTCDISIVIPSFVFFLLYCVICDGNVDIFLFRVVKWLDSDVCSFSV